MKKQTPPPLATRFLNWFCNRKLVAEIEGDLFESYQQWYKESGARRARLWYWLNVCTFFRPYFISKIKLTSPSNLIAMIKNYFKIAFRTLVKHRSFTAINVSGLAIGVMAALVIALYAYNELSYDRFHPLADHIYLVYKERVTPNGVQPTYDTWLPLTERLESEFPEIENATRSFVENTTIEVDQQQFETETMLADPEFFKMFNFPLLQGNTDQIFSTQNSVLLTRETARKLFGDENPIGKTMTIDYDLECTVSGVLADIPSNSSLQFDVVMPMQNIPDYKEMQQDWGNSFLSSYILLPNGAAARQLEAKFPDLVTKIYGEEVQSRTNFKLLPFTASYDTFIGNSKNVYILLIIACSIILIASVNFMNLSTARALERMPEIGMRKTFGARRGQLVNQFMSEAILLSLASVFVGVMLTELMLPLFNQLFDMQLHLPLANIKIILLLLSFAMVLGLLSGSYPALFLSRFKIMQSLKGKLSSNQNGISFRNALVVVQFSASIFLIGCAVMVWQQLSFMQHADLAFDKEHVIVLPVGMDNFEGTKQDSARLQIFKNELLAHPDVQAVTSSAHIPTRWEGWFTFVQPKDWQGDPMRMRVTYGDGAYFKTLGIDLLEGRAFHEGSMNDRNEAVILNQAAMRAFGWDHIDGKSIEIGSRELQVVGLAHDYNFESMRNEVAPILHFYRKPDNAVHSFVTVRIKTGNYQEMIGFLQEKWNWLLPGRTFEYSFMDEQVARLYETENRLLGMVSAFSMVAILIACMGLLGLSQYTLQKRKKEIGIRKVLGASVGKILVMVGKDFTVLILVSLLIAVPLAYWAINQWLKDFAYRIDVNVLLLIGAGSAALVIAWLTISIQSVRAAQANPVDSLRNE